MRKLLQTILLISSGYVVIANANIIEKMKARIPKIAELKDKGIIGEQEDGLLGLVKADPAAKKLVEEENKDRIEFFKARAKEQGHSLEDLQKALGEGKISKESTGRFIKVNGEWKKK